MQYQNFSGVMSQISTVWKLYGYILYTYIHIPNYTVGDERLRFPAKHFQNFGSLGNPSFVKGKKKKKSNNAQSCRVHLSSIYSLTLLASPATAVFFLLSSLSSTASCNFSLLFNFRLSPRSDVVGLTLTPIMLLDSVSFV